MSGFSDRDFRLSNNLDRLTNRFIERLSHNFSDRLDHRLHQKNTFFSLFNGPTRAFSEVRQQARSPLKRRNFNRHPFGTIQEIDHRRNAENSSSVSRPRRMP